MIRDIKNIPSDRTPYLLDKTGRMVEIGDILKVFHFTAALRRKRHYMYKQIVGYTPQSQIVGGKHPDRFKVSNLNLEDTHYSLATNNTTNLDIEIVAAGGASIMIEDRICFRNLKKL